MKTTLFGALLFAIFFAAGSVQAQVNAESSAASSMSTGVQLSAQTAATTSEAKGNVEVNFKVEEGQKGGPALLEIDTIKGESPDTSKRGGEKGGTEDINIGVGGVGGTPVVQHNQSDLDFLKGNAVSARAVEVRGWDPKQKQEFLATVKAEAQVQSGQDLENFAKGVLLADDNVEEVSSDEDSVEVRYRVPAKFLGLFETTLPVEVVAEEAQGELGARVRVKFPWFRFFFGVPDEVSETALESSVSAAVIGDLDRDGALDVVVAARLLSAISNVLKTKHDTVKNSIGNIR